MRIIVQRVLRAACQVGGKTTGSINQGMMILIGFGSSDENLPKETLDKAAKKLAGLRIFSDNDGKMNLNINQINGKILAISQFTLYANPYEGNRPSFTNSLRFDLANQYYLDFLKVLREDFHLEVEEGIFGADMKLDILCDGPVTITYEF